MCASVGAAAAAVRGFSREHVRASVRHVLGSATVTSLSDARLPVASHSISENSDSTLCKDKRDSSALVAASVLQDLHNVV